MRPLDIFSGQDGFSFKQNAFLDKFYYVWNICVSYIFSINTDICTELINILHREMLLTTVVLAYIFLALWTFRKYAKFHFFGTDDII